MTEQQKKIAAGAGFAVLAAAILYWELYDPGTPNPAATAPAAEVAPSTAGPTQTAAGTVGSGPVLRTSVRPGAARRPLSEAEQLDPTLHMGAMLLAETLAYSGSGRNIFSANSAAPVSLPRPVASARPKTFHTVVNLPPPGPPPPPSIDLTFFGTATPEGGTRRAFFLRDGDVYLAAAGEIVQRRYKVLTISPNSVVVEDLLNNNRQTLPLSN